MYDNYIDGEKYYSFKDTIVNILNGDDEKTDINKLNESIQEEYNEGKISSSQYDDLMRYMQDIMSY